MQANSSQTKEAAARLVLTDPLRLVSMLWVSLGFNLLPNDQKHHHEHKDVITGLCRGWRWAVYILLGSRGRLSTAMEWNYLWDHPHPQAGLSPPTEGSLWL